MKSNLWKWIAVLAITVVLAGVVIYSNRCATLQRLFERALDWVAALGVWGQVLFVSIYIVATVLLIPGSALGRCDPHGCSSEIHQLSFR